MTIRLMFIWYRAISPGVKPAFSADVKNEWMYASILPYAFMARTGIIFLFYLLFNLQTPN